MPSKNIIRIEAPDSYFHIYNRGVEKRKIFLQEEDYLYFISLLARHLSLTPQKDGRGYPYAHYRALIDLNAYCLMPNHFHLLVYQKEDATAITQLMRSITTAYTMYFNKKYSRHGCLFETRYKASLIVNDAYLYHISRYIHLNPKGYRHWPHSSYQAYLTNIEAYDWLHTQPILELFDSQADYRAFVDDYEELHRELEDLKHHLANY